jgi:hypothetical protein
MGYIYICGIFMNNVEQLGGDDERIEEPGGHAGENGTTGSAGMRLGNRGKRCLSIREKVAFKKQENNRDLAIHPCDVDALNRPSLRILSERYHGRVQPL